MRTLVPSAGCSSPVFTDSVARTTVPSRVSNSSRRSPSTGMTTAVVAMPWARRSASWRCSEKTKVPTTIPSTISAAPPPTHHRAPLRLRRGRFGAATAADDRRRGGGAGVGAVSPRAEVPAAGAIRDAS